MINWTQALVLGFFVVAWVSLVAILLAAPGVFVQAVKLPPGDSRPWELIFLAALSAFLVVLGIGVLRRWRWTFWLIAVAFLAGALRVPASILELSGVVAMDSPTWYVAFQALLGLVQFGIGLAMLAGYRRGAAWGAF